MSLSVVATPIGNPQDITLRAIEALKSAEVIIGEEFRETTTLLKRLGIPKPQLESLNEHSKPEDLKALLEACKTKNVVLISDCGTPGFCDPGADLVDLCRKNQIPVHPVPGASSLMALLAVSGRRLENFVFHGFLPAKTEAREAALTAVGKEPRAQIIMDTPYRLEKLLGELARACPGRTGFLGLNMTAEGESYHSGTLAQLQAQASGKAEFVLLIDPK